MAKEMAMTGRASTGVIAEMRAAIAACEQARSCATCKRTFAFDRRGLVATGLKTGPGFRVDCRSCADTQRMAALDADRVRLEERAPCRLPFRRVVAAAAAPHVAASMLRAG